MKDYSFDSRKYILGGVVILVLVTYIIRLFNIQLQDEGYKEQADNNAYYKKTIYPARGHMYDRNGKLLVYNQPSYDVTFIPRETKNVDVDELCSALGMTRHSFLKAPPVYAPVQKPWPQYFDAPDCRS